MTRILWNDLSYFQSFDLVQREFKNWHGRELNTERTEEIVSSFIQGREYFESARSAAEAVRPLLLYYAVLSVSKALIIFLSGKSEATLKPSHGLSTVGWEETLKTSGQSILDLEVSIEEGTFSELAVATNNSTLLRLHRLDTGLIITPKSPPVGESSPRRLILRDVLSREPLLSILYREVTQARSNARPGMIIDNERALVVRLVYDPVVGTTESEELKALFHVPSNTAVSFAPANEIHSVPALAYRLPHESGGAYSAACPIIEYPNDDQGYLIAPWPNSGYLSPLLRCFVQAYFLGMLSRYFPSRWLRLIRGQKGDAVLPLLRQATEHLMDNFPGLIRRELRNFRD